MVNSIVIILVSLVASIFFTGMEIAFISSDKLRLELNKSKDVHYTGFISRYIDRADLYHASWMIGNMLALIFFSLAVIDLHYSFLSLFNNFVILVALQVVLITIALLITGYLIPKSIFDINPNRTLTILSIPAAVFFYLFYPLSRICVSAAQFLSGKWYRRKDARTNRNNLFSKIKQAYFTGKVENSMGDAHHELESEIKLFKNALEFTNVRVRDCMIQRPDMEIMEETSAIEELRLKFTETGLSKILIYKDHIDNIIGYVHSFDLFNQPANISSCLREISFVPETMEAKKLLSKLLREHKSIAIVVDEFGGTAGMITTEDILEEIFGEIEDEHDKPDFISKKINEDRYIFSGRMEIESINEMYDLDLETDISYETIAGYILFHHSSFPKSNSILQVGKYEFRILRSSRTSIDLVELRILEK